MARKFSEFDNSTSPASTDNVVGFRPGATNVNKRWTWSSVVSFLQGILDITLLNRSADNHVQISGAGSGSSPLVTAAGTDANIDLTIAGKGVGAVIVDGALQIGDDTTVNGDFYTSGGSINTVGGNINLSSGNLNMSGTISLSGAGKLSTDHIESFSGTINLNDPVSAGIIAATDVDSDTATFGSGTEELDINATNMIYGGADGITFDVTATTATLTLGDSQGLVTLDSDGVSRGHVFANAFFDGGLLSNTFMTHNEGADSSTIGITQDPLGTNRRIHLFIQNAGDPALQIDGFTAVTVKATGYVTMTGTADRGSAYDTSTITLSELAERVKAMQDDLTSHHGLLGA